MLSFKKRTKYKQTKYIDFRDISAVTVLISIRCFHVTLLDSTEFIHHVKLRDRYLNYGIAETPAERLIIY